MVNFGQLVTQSKLDCQNTIKISYNSTALGQLLTFLGCLLLFWKLLVIGSDQKWMWWALCLGAASVTYFYYPCKILMPSGWEGSEDRRVPFPLWVPGSLAESGPCSLCFLLRLWSQWRSWILWDALAHSFAMCEGPTMCWVLCLELEDKL